MSKYSVKLLSKSKAANFPSFQAELYEGDVLVARFSRGRVMHGFLPPIETKFLSEAAQRRFITHADTLTVGEVLEAMLSL